MAVLIVEDKVRDDIGRRIGTPLGVEVAGFGREAPDLGNRLAEILLGDLQPRHELFVMFLDELVEIVGQDLARETLRPRIERLLLQLQEQAFPQIAGPDTGRFQLVNHPEQPFELLGRSLDTHRKGDVVGDRLQVAPQVAVLVDAAHEIGRQPHVPLRKVAVTELFDQVFRQRTPLGKVNRALFVVFRKVVDAAFVRGRIILAQVLVHGDLLGLLLLFGDGLLLKDDILLDLLLDALLELHGGQLQQLDHLDLLRRELLLKRQYLFLIYGHNESNLRILVLKLVPSFSGCSIRTGSGQHPRKPESGRSVRLRPQAGFPTVKSRRASAYAGRAVRRGCS